MLLIIGSRVKHKTNINARRIIKSKLMYVINNTLNSQNFNVSFHVHIFTFIEL